MFKAFSIRFPTTLLLFGLATLMIACSEDKKNTPTPAPARDSFRLENAQDSVAGPASRSLIEATARVRNTGSASKNVKVKRYVITEVEGAENSICWGVQCYPPTVTVTEDFQTIAPNSTDTTFKADYLPWGNVGISRYLYVFFDVNNPNDSTSILITFNGQ
jgi:hypothetical protein